MLNIAGLFFAVAVILGAGGLLKLVRPVDTSTALETLSLPSSHGLVRLLGLIELGVALYAIISGSAVGAVLVGSAYVAFAGFVLIALRSGTPLQSCGCFGKADTPPSTAHILINLASATVAFLVATKPLGIVTDVFAQQPASGFPLVLLVGVLAYILYVALTALPQALKPSARTQ